MGQEIDYYDFHIIVKEHPKVQKYKINLFKIIKKLFITFGIFSIPTT